MAQSIEQRLAGYQRRYRELAAELADLGYIAAGSITQRSTRCGTPSCRCHADPPRLHGPYWQWTAKVNGKTTASVRPTPSSTTSGSATTGNYARQSPECGRSPPKPAN